MTDPATTFIAKLPLFSGLVEDLSLVGVVDGVSWPPPGATVGLGDELGLAVGMMVLSDWQLWASADVQVGLLLLS